MVGERPAASRFGLKRLAPLLLELGDAGAVLVARLTWAILGLGVDTLDGLLVGEGADSVGESMLRAAIVLGQQVETRSRRVILLQGRLCTGVARGAQTGAAYIQI